MGGLALFVTVGIIVAIASLVRPDQESFDARARNLFRRASGRHVDFAVERIKGSLEPYAERVDCKVKILEYHPGEKKYRIQMYDDIVIRSYLDDVDTTFHSRVKFAKATPAPSGCCENSLIYLRIDEEDVVKKLPFNGDSLDYPYTAEIKRDCACRTEILSEFWVNADDEPFTHDPVRYTQLLTLVLENHVSAPARVDIRIKETSMAKHTIA